MPKRGALLQHATFAVRLVALARWAEEHLGPERRPAGVGALLEVAARARRVVERRAALLKLRALLDRYVDLLTQTFSLGLRALGRLLCLAGH